MFHKQNFILNLLNSPKGRLINSILTISSVKLSVFIFKVIVCKAIHVLGMNYFNLKDFSDKE